MVKIPGSWYGFFSYLVMLVHGNANWFHGFFGNKYKINAIYVFPVKLKYLG